MGNKFTYVQESGDLQGYGVVKRDAPGQGLTIVSGIPADATKAEATQRAIDGVEGGWVEAQVVGPVGPRFVRT